MNDFSDLENQLKSLRPAPLRESLIARMEQAMTAPSTAEVPDNIIRPHRFRLQWIAGLSLAAAAALLLLVRVNFQPPQAGKKLASTSPASTTQTTPNAVTVPFQPTERPTVANAFVPAGATQVVYHKRDEGLLFAKNSEQPMRKLRSMTQETLQWRNPSTGASLRVSYPSEQVELIPVSGQ